MFYHIFFIVKCFSKSLLVWIMIIVMIIIILIIVQHLGYASAVSNQQPRNKRSFTAFTNPKGASDSLTLSVSHIFLGLQNLSVGFPLFPCHMLMFLQSALHDIIKGSFLLNYHFLDPRTARWLFVPSILSPAVFVIAYLVLIWLLPKVMKDKEPFQLTNLLLLYNTAMVLLNFYISVEVFQSVCAVRE